MIAADTNVYVYALDGRDAEKQAAARIVVAALTATGQPVALQVVGELQNALRRGLGMPAFVASQHARNVYASGPSFPYDAVCVDLALGLSAAGRYGYWDALLLAACSRAGIETLFSEDMHDGAVLEGVRVINPFGAQGLSDTARELLDGLAP